MPGVSRRAGLVAGFAIQMDNVRSKAAASREHSIRFAKSVVLARPDLAPASERKKNCLNAWQRT
jgi:hypothetical protein